MANRQSNAAWVFVICLAVLNGALYGAVTYLRHHNPAYWVMVSDDFQKILLARQYPERLDAEGVPYRGITGVELQGAATFVEPHRAEVYVNTVDGQRIRVHYAKSGAEVHARDLSKRLEVPLRVIDYAPPQGASEIKRSGPAPGEAPPTLPDAR